MKDSNEIPVDQKPETDIPPEDSVSKEIPAVPAVGENPEALEQTSAGEPQSQLSAGEMDPSDTRFAALQKAAGMFGRPGKITTAPKKAFSQMPVAPTASKFQALKQTAGIFTQPEAPEKEETTANTEATEIAAAEKTEKTPEQTEERKFKHITIRKPGEKNEAQLRLEAIVKRDFDDKIVKVRHFKSGKLDNYGLVVGIFEYTGEFPHVRQDHSYDEHDRVLKLEKFEKDFSKPTSRLYFYEGDGNKIVESVWLDRYGKIDNIHRYAYDMETGLMMQRAEYDREGRLFYLIKTKYDLEKTPPREMEEAWYDKKDNLIKRQEYIYNEKEEIITENHYDSNNQFDGAFHFTYDERGILHEKKWQNKNRRFMSTFRYTVDADENTIKAELLDAEGNLESYQTFAYDAVGNITGEKWFDANGEMFKDLKF